MDILYIEQIVLDYIKSPLSNRYAIQINGDWGTGKTHYWKTHIKPLVAQCEYKTTYISLNGVNAIDTILNKIFESIIFGSGKTSSRIAKALTNESSRYGSKFFTKINAFESFKNIYMGGVLDYSKRFFCFDDLERCSLPIDEVMGYINDLVEHRNSKVLILCNDTKLKEKGINYFGTKEKLIGRVFQFKPDIKASYQSILKEAGYHDAIIDFFMKWQSLITSLFKKYNQVNLRHLIFIFDILSHLHPHIKNIPEKYIKEIIFFTMIISFEFKEGFLNSEDVVNYPKFENLGLIAFQSPSYSKSNKTEEEINEKVKFIEKYDLMVRDIHFVAYRAIYTYVLTGLLNVEMFKQEIDIRNEMFIPEEDDIDFRLILNSYNYPRLENSDFSSHFKQLWHKAEQGVYSIYEYARIAEFFFYFQNHGIIDKTVDEIMETTKRGIDSALSKSQYNANTLDSIMHFKKDSNTSEIVNYIKEKHDSINNLSQKLIGDKMIEAITNLDYETFDKLSTQIKETIGFLFPIFNPQSLCNAIDKTSNRMIVSFNDIISERISLASVAKQKNIEPLAELKEYLIEKLKSEQIQQPRKHLFHDLIASLDNPELSKAT